MGKEDRMKNGVIGKKVVATCILILTATFSGMVGGVPTDFSSFAAIDAGQGVKDSPITVESLADHIVINEIEQNPKGKDAGNEWVELYNPTDKAINISGWVLQTTHGTVEIHHIHEMLIDPGEYLVITFSDQFLDNRDESLILFDENGKEIDRTPIVGDDDNDDKTWQRIPDGYDSDSPSDWSFLASTREKPNHKNPIYPL